MSGGTESEDGRPSEPTRAEDTWDAASFLERGALGLVRLRKGQTIDGRYIVGDEIGRGGSSQVYRAWDKKVGRDIALKILTGRSLESAQQQRFREEARMLIRVTHPSIVHLYDYGVHDGAPFLVTELLEGEDLASAIRHRRVGNRDRKLEIARQITRALQAIHARKIVHGDVKPANVFLNRGGHVTLLDLGVAEATDAATQEPRTLRGTLGYLAPERFRGKPATAEADVYALGVLLFELFSGRTAFENGPIDAVFRTASEPLPVEAMGEEFASLAPTVARMTAKDATVRATLDTALQAFDAFHGSGDERASAPVRSSTTLRTRAAGAGAGLVTVAALVGVWYASGGSGPADPQSTRAHIAPAVEPTTPAAPKPAPAQTEANPPPAPAQTERTSAPDPPVAPQDTPPQPPKRSATAPSDVRRSPSRRASEPPTALPHPPRAATNEPVSPAPSATDKSALATPVSPTPDPPTPAPLPGPPSAPPPRAPDDEPSQSDVAKPSDEAAAVDQQQLLAVVERLITLYRGKDLKAIERLWPTLTADQKHSLEKAFAKSREYHIEMTPMGPAEIRRASPREGRPDVAVLRLRRRVRAILVGSRESSSVEDIVVLHFERRSGGWVVTASES